MITFGTSYVGKVARLPGTFYVVTKVFQVINVPLIPLSGHIVWEGTESQSFIGGLQDFEGQDISLSMKSLAWAWVRTLWFAIGLFGSLGVIDMLILNAATDPGEDLSLTLRVIMLTLHALSIVALVMWFRTRKGRRLKDRAWGLEIATALEIPKDEFKVLWKRSLTPPH